MLPLRARVLPLLCVFLGAPIVAEYLQAYLPFTGEVWMSLFGIVFFAPLYGGAALLIREVSIRTRMGWPGTLLLGAAFGLAMTGILDLSMFGEDRPDVAYWAELREPTLIEPLGLSVGATVSWVLGHVIMSIGAPLALLYALAPAHRGRPLLGKLGMPLTVAAAAVVALAVHSDGQTMYGYTLSAGRAAAVLAAILVIIAAAFLVSRRFGGDHADTGAGRVIPAVAVVAAAAVFKMAIDFMPSTWIGLVGTVLVSAGGGVALWRAPTRWRWGAREIGAVGAGLVIGAILIGFVAPVPDGVSVAAKLAQSSVLLVLAVGLLWAVLRRTGRDYLGSVDTGAGDFAAARGATASPEGRNRPDAKSRP